MSKKNVYVIRSTAFVLSEGLPTPGSALAGIRQHLEDLEAAAIEVELLTPADLAFHDSEDLASFIPYEHNEDGVPSDGHGIDSVLTHINREIDQRKRESLVDNLRDTLGANDYTPEEVDLVCKAVQYSESEQVTKSIVEQIKSNKTY